MSVVQKGTFRVKYNWSMEMRSWHRGVLSLIYGIGVIMIALWALEQGSGPWVVLGVTGMSCLTLMLIFGIEIDKVEVGQVGTVTFSDTTGDDDND